MLENLILRLWITADAYRDQATLYNGRRADWRLARADRLERRADTLLHSFKLAT